MTGGQRLVLPLLLVAAPFLFALGITLPLLTFEKLVFFEESPSLLGIVAGLYDNGDIALCLLVALFSIAFPLVKMAAIMAEAITRPGEASGLIGRMVPFLSKWSMMDVMLVAIVIAAAKTSGLANAFSQSGLWFYAASALLTPVAHWLVIRARAE